MIELRGHYEGRSKGRHHWAASLDGWHRMGHEDAELFYRNPAIRISQPDDETKVRSYPADDSHAEMPLCAPSALAVYLLTSRCLISADKAAGSGHAGLP